MRREDNIVQERICCCITFGDEPQNIIRRLLNYEIAGFTILLAFGFFEQKLVYFMHSDLYLPNFFIFAIFLGYGLILIQAILIRHTYKRQAIDGNQEQTLTKYQCYRLNLLVFSFFKFISVQMVYEGKYEFKYREAFFREVYLMQLLSCSLIFCMLRSSCKLANVGIKAQREIQTIKDLSDHQNQLENIENP